MGLLEGDAKKVIVELERKAGLVKWRNGGRKEHYGIVAKSIEGKEELKAEGYLVFDLDYMGWICS